MDSTIHDFVMTHELFSYHDHHITFAEFEKKRASFNHRTFLGYAGSDLVTAAGPRPSEYTDDDARLNALWPNIRTTGYGRAVVSGCKELFGIEYAPKNFERITEALQTTIADMSASEVYDYFVKGKANIRWVAQDGLFRPENAEALQTNLYPDYYRFAVRMDDLFAIADADLWTYSNVLPMSPY